MNEPNRPRAIDKVNASLEKRYKKERRFKFLGLTVVMLGLLFVSLLYRTVTAAHGPLEIA